MSNLLRLPAVQLAVIGMALVTVSLRPGPAGAAAAVPHVAPPPLHVVPVAQRHHHRVTHHRTTHPVVAHRAIPPAPNGPTSWAALNTAIARIPTYPAGTSRWIVSGRYGHWGTTDWYHDTLYISPTVPVDRLYDVAVHEWSHELSVLDYHGDVGAAVKAMARYFGGSGLTGAERAADCMARLQGAGWTHYTSCTDRRWRSGAAKLLRGGVL
jgi:hypothetical protein